MKNNKRALRRYLTERYRKKQIRLYERYFQETPKTPGHYRRHSWRDCGQPRCPMCGNQRRNGFLPKDERLTMQERRCDEALSYEMENLNMDDEAIG